MHDVQSHLAHSHTDFGPDVGATFDHPGDGPAADPKMSVLFDNEIVEIGLCPDSHVVRVTEALDFHLRWSTSSGGDKSED